MANLGFSCPSFQVLAEPLGRPGAKLHSMKEFDIFIPFSLFVGSDIPNPHLNFEPLHNDLSNCLSTEVVFNKLA